MCVLMVVSVYCCGSGNGCKVGVPGAVVSCLAGVGGIAISAGVVQVKLVCRLQWHAILG